MKRLVVAGKDVTVEALTEAMVEVRTTRRGKRGPRKDDGDDVNETALIGAESVERVSTSSLKCSTHVERWATRRPTAQRGAGGSRESASCATRRGV